MFKALGTMCEHWESFLDYREVAVREVDALYSIPSLSDLSLGYPAVFLLVGLALEDAGQPQARMPVPLVGAVLCLSLCSQQTKCRNAY